MIRTLLSVNGKGSDSLGFQLRLERDGLWLSINQIEREIAFWKIFHSCGILFVEVYLLMPLLETESECKREEG